MKQDKDKVEYVSEDLSAEASAKAEGRIKKLKQELKFCQKERAEYLAGWQRAKADYINFKREQEQKIADCYKFANESLILELLPVLDSFEAAILHLEQNKKTATADYAKTSKDAKNFAILRRGEAELSDSTVTSQSLTEGIKQVRAQLMEILKSNGLEEIKAIGEKFNPELHEVIEASPEPNRGTELTIIEEVQKGYKLHGKVMRPSKVKIGE